MKTPLWTWQYDEWPHFCWNNDSIIVPLARVREKQGRLLGLMNGLGFDAQSASSLEAMTEEVLRNSEIEGLMLNPTHVRSSVAWHLDIDTAGMPSPSHYTDGVVQVLLDAVSKANEPLSEQRLFSWHAALFPSGRSGLTPINIGGGGVQAQKPCKWLAAPWAEKQFTTKHRPQPMCQG